MHFCGLCKIELSVFIRSHAHGGGDERIIDGLYHVLRKECENRTTLHKSVRCHLIGIAAEKSRRAGGVLVKVDND